MKRVAAELTRQHAERVHALIGPRRQGEQTSGGAFTHAGRLQRYGRQRVVIGHARAEVPDVPRCRVTDAWHGERGRVLAPWRAGWAAESCHEVGTPVTGVQAAQRRQEAAGTRHFRLRGGAPSSVQRTPPHESTAARCAVADGPMPYGQQWRAMGRDVMRPVLELITRLLAHGQACAAVVAVVRPAEGCRPSRRTGSFKTRRMCHERAPSAHGPTGVASAGV